MPDGQGRFFFPGIQAWDSFSMTDVSGIAPAVGILKCYPQYGLPAASGDIVLEYDDIDRGTQRIVFKNCILDAASVQRNSGGAIVSCRFLDERWSWRHRSITGRYNIRLPNNFVDPDHEKNPRELARLCFEALGITEFETHDLPIDPRPEIDWENANPAEELAKLCDELGYRIVPKRSDGSWEVVRTGDGADLPNNLPYNDASDGLDPKEKPDYIKIVTAPKLFQVALQMEPVGKDTDYSWRRVDLLSYCPQDGGLPAPVLFCLSFRDMANISPIRQRLPDGTAISPRELALQTVLKSFRVRDEPFIGETGQESRYVEIPGYDEQVATRKQLILTDELVQAYEDDRGGFHKRPAFMWGEFFGEMCESGNYPPGTRIDYQSRVYQEEEEERSSFSISFDPIDTDRTIAHVSKPLVLKGVEVLGSEFNLCFPYLTTAVQVRDPDTWQPVRYEYFKQIGTGENKENCAVFIKNDIQWWSIAQYDKDGSYTGVRDDNRDEVSEQCAYYADAIAKTYELISTGTRTYFGLYQIDLDGAIQQVSYRLGKQGFDTIASRGTEHDFDIPQYQERRQRDGRQNVEEKLKLIKYIGEQRAKLRGTFNT